MDEKLLRQIIRQELQTLSEARMMKTREGSRVDYASEEYIAELEKDLEELVNMRKRRGMRERERYVLSQAVKHVRASLKRANKALEKRIAFRKAAETDLITDGEK